MCLCRKMDNTVAFRCRVRLLGGKLPDVVAYTDGSLIKIMKPSLENNRAAYIGRKSYASMNVQ